MKNLSFTELHPIFRGKEEVWSAIRAEDRVAKGSSCRETVVEEPASSAADCVIDDMLMQRPEDHLPHQPM